MDNFPIRNGRRKSPGPHRSATSLDNFLTPGVLFRFPSNFSDSKMSATFVSACSPGPTGINSFLNISSDLVDKLFLEQIFDSKPAEYLDDSILNPFRAIHFVP